MKTDEMLPEYDFSSGIRGRYAGRYAGGSNVVVLAPDVSKVFPDSDAVNSALRGLLRLANPPSRKRAHSKRLVSTPQKRRKTA